MEIETEDQVGLFDGAGGAALGVGLEYHHVAYARHPVEIVGILVGDDAGDRMSRAAQRLGPCDGRAYGVAVGVGMRKDHYPPLRSLQKTAQSFDILC